MYKYNNNYRKKEKRKKEVHQVSINKRSIEIKYGCVFFSIWYHNAIVVDSVFLPYNRMCT